MRKEDFFFTVPEDLIAHEPLLERDSSRLLVWHSEKISHHRFTELPDWIEENSLLIVNRTRVFNCRIVGQKDSGAKIELFLTSLPAGEAQASAEAIGKPIKKLRVGTVVFFTHGLQAVIQEISGQNLRIVFSVGEEDLMRWLQINGQVPLPPYIKKSQSSYTQEAHRERYQTVYAEKLGSVAAPTAGFHFTERTLAALRKKNTRILPIYLHVGLGTFLPVKSEDVGDHKMHRESFMVPRKTWKQLDEARRKGLKIYGVGTTSFRALEGLRKLSREHSVNLDTLTDKWHQTDLFIFPESEDSRFQSEFFDGIITNFHQPCSTLYMLISALVGLSHARKIYEEAIRERYRFFSYGDSSLLFFR